MDNAPVPETPVAAPVTPDPTAALAAELASLRAWKAEREVEESRRAELARVEEQRRLADKGQIDELVKRHAADLDAERRRVAEADARHKTAERNRELTLALA